MSFNDFLASQPTFRGAQRPEVLETSEFQRIRDTEWRPWHEASDLAAGATALTQMLRLPGCAGHVATPDGRCSVCGSPLALRPIQAAVLRDMVERSGCIAPILAGGGKTLISLTLETTLQIMADRGLIPRSEVGRPLLVVPAALREKTRRDAAVLSNHWRISAVKIVSYEAMGRVNMHGLLDNYEPTSIFADEAHYLKNTRAGVTRVFSEHIRKRRKAGTRPRQCYASGSFTSRTLRDYWHLCRWALDQPPLPRDPAELQLWCWALDEKVSDGVRVSPGALLGLAPPVPSDDAELPEDPEEHDLVRARRRYARRFRATPGVVASGSDLPAVGLVCDKRVVPPSPAMEAASRHLRDTWTTPCGMPFETAMDLWRHEREISCGLYYVWTERPPAEWLAARKAWSGFVRDTLAHSRTLFTVFAVQQAVAEGRLPADRIQAGRAAWDEWQRVEATFTPVTKPVWICDSQIELTAEWLAKEQGIAWVYHQAFGEKLSAVTGVPYYRAQGCEPSGQSIEHRKGPAIASIKSCHRGFNLQFNHFKNLVVTSPTKNETAEQLLARTHRQGQPSDDVHATFVQRLEGDMAALAQARADARYVEQSLNQPQRLTVATWTDE